MQKILIIEDSRTVAKMLAFRLERALNRQTKIARSLLEARLILGESHTSFFAVLSDLTLPDAPNGEVIDYLETVALPTIVISGTTDQALKNFIAKKKIIDLISKRNFHEMDYLVRLIRQLDTNRNHKTLIVDNEPTMRSFLRNQLEMRNHNVSECQSGAEAIAWLQHKNPALKLLIIDEHLADMTGIELLIETRKLYTRHQLAILCFSSRTNAGAPYLKAGANDFLLRPFKTDEFQCRILQCLECIE